MKPWTVICLSAALLATTRAAAGDISASCPVRWMPPKQYDREPAVLPVEWDMDLWAIDAKCRQPTLYYAGDSRPDGRYYGCARQFSGYWEIIVPKAGSDGINEYCHELSIRHEWGHVNGWPSDHEGAVPAEDATSMGMGVS